MVRNIFILSTLCCFLIFLQSCVHGSLEECPPMVNYAVAFKYTHNAWNNDRFRDDAKKVDLYVFDKDELFYTKKTGLRTKDPFEPNFTIPLDLPMGTYHILAWCNVLDVQPFNIFPLEFNKGVTTINQARLSLQREAGNLSHQDMDKLLFGDSLHVEIPLYVNRVDTIPLINDTKHIRIVIHWDHTGELRATQQVVNYNDVEVRLAASNAEYNFSNNFTGVNNVVYTPYQYAYDTLYLAQNEREFEQRIYCYDKPVNYTITNACVYDFAILRMMENNPITITIGRNKKVPSASVVLFKEDIVAPVVNYFHVTRGITLPNATQSEFDKYDNYRIDFYFTYDEIAGEYVTGNFKIDNWHWVNQPEIPMN